jgi:multidrug efflux pump subunit AcrA (membrane-fusion protein)
MLTSTATLGTISITATGSGTLLPSQTANLAFGASSEVEEVLVAVGDHVAQGDILARADDTVARQAVAEAKQAVMDAEIDLALATGKAELSVAEAEAALVAAEETLDGLVNWDPDSVELTLAKASLATAQASYRNTSTKAGMVDQQNASVRISLDQAISALASAQQAYAEAMNPERDWERGIEDARENAAASLVRAQQNLELAQADYDLATIDNSAADVQSSWAQVLNAREAVAELEEAPTAEEIAAAGRAVKEAELTLQQARLELGDEGQAVAWHRAELALEQAEMNLATAQKTLDGMVLIAPFSGTIVEVAIEVGETASGTAIVLSDLNTPVVQFWVDESDMSSVAVGYPVEIVFSALPDLTFGGEVYQVDPVMVTVGSTPAVQAWATLDATAHTVTLLGEMNADVDIVAGEAVNAVIVPVEALRAIGEDQRAVFVVLSDGTLEMRLVEVGLSNYVNVEIKSGLAAGEVVSLGEATASPTEVTTDTEFPAGGMMFAIEGGPMPGGGSIPGGGGRP